MGNRCSPYKSRRRNHALLAARKLGLRSCFHPAVGRLADRMRDGIRVKSNGLDLVLFVFTLHYCLQDTGSWIVSCVSDITQLSFFDVQPLVFNTQTHPNKCGTFVVRELCPVFSAGSCVTGQLARFPFQLVGIMQLLDKKLGEV